MMAYHQRVSQYRSPRRIDFDDPSTTKPPSLAKSAVLAALEEEERQKSRGTVERPSRSRQPARMPATNYITTTTTATPTCIDRETVLKINRRPMQRRHRSCENVWPPKPNSSSSVRARDAVLHPLPNRHARTGDNSTESELEFAIGSRRYGSQDSVYFDERVRRQHKIEPLRTMFDRENVVLTDWGHRPSVASEQNVRHGTPEPLTTNCPAQVDVEVPAEPPVPPPRRYYLPLDKIRVGAGGEVDSILHQLQDKPLAVAVERPSSALPSTEYRRSATPSLPVTLKTPERSKSVQGQPILGQGSRTATVGLKQDGLDAKPPKKLKPSARSTVRSSEAPGAVVGLSVTLQRYPTVTDVSDCGDSMDPSPTVPTERIGLEGFDLNSNMVLNLNIDVRHRNTSPTVGSEEEPLHQLPPSSSTPVPSNQLSANYFDKQCSGAVTATTATTSTTSFPLADTVTDFGRDQRFPLEHTQGRWPAGLELTPADDGHQHQQQHQRECFSPRQNQAIHNYNEKLITDISLMGQAPALTDASLDVGLSLGGQRLPQSSSTSSPSSSALNVSNQPNRNWINLNSNQIHHQRLQRGYCSSSSIGSGSGSGTTVISSCQRELSVVREPRIIPGAVAIDTERCSSPHVAPPLPNGCTQPDRGQILHQHQHQPANDSPIPPVSECRSHDCNYDNKSVRSHYRANASSPGTVVTVASPPVLRYVTPSPPLPPPPPLVEPRARSGSSGSSVKINEIFEFPPPPPFPCDCGIEAESQFPYWWPGPDVSPADTGRDCSTSAQVTHPTGTPTLGQPPNVNKLTASGPTSSNGKAPRPAPEPSLQIHHLNAPAPGQPGNDNHVIIIGAEGDDHTPLHHRCTTNPTSGTLGATDGGANAEPPPMGDRSISSKSIPRTNPVGDVDYFKTNSTNGDEIGKPIMPRRPPSVDRLTGHQHKQRSPPSPELMLMEAAAATAAEPDKPFTPTGTSIDGQSLSQQQPEDASSSSNSRNNFDHQCSPVRVISFTDGEYIFGPFDARSSEFEQFEFLSSKFAPRASTCSPVRRSFGDAIGRDDDGEPGDHDNADGGDDDQRKIATEHHHDPDVVDYSRWARFENGNISPSPPAPAPPSASDDTATTAKRLTRGDEIEEIFQQLNQTLKENVTRPEPETDSAGEHTSPSLPVENVPVIESILDDLLTFSKQLDRGCDSHEEHETGTGAAVNRADAPLTEINDDNLINLLADDGDNVGDTSTTTTDPGRQDAVDVDKSRNGCGQTLLDDGNVDEDGDDDGDENVKSSINNGAGGNQFHRASTAVDANGSMAGPAPQEDIFTNVAIFNWNALDAYQQHGLFMIDPRFALADMRAISPSLVSPLTGVGGTMSSLPTVPEEPVEQLVGVNDAIGSTVVKNDSAAPRQQRPVTVEGINNSSIVTVNAEPARGVGQQNVNAPTSYHELANCDRKVNTCHHRGDDDGQLSEPPPSDKIVQMNQVLHFYDACHVRYPVVSCTEHRAANVQEHDSRDGHGDVDGSGMPVTTRRPQAEEEEGTPTSSSAT
ncbi:uncharacterized protein LOC126577262 isoform X2 [Anopheles aquasalis]|uniref:uncharacterized protein LOC126577262 isoform X2 n=1 Tax=Anopheles aquasalis TaxID=42839 RepID=UPI00215A2FF1|nr:uncharacterized protein LOC126577262 isoform X2 [Anopheles aquasalis]